GLKLEIALFYSKILTDSLCKQSSKVVLKGANPKHLKAEERVWKLVRRPELPRNHDAGEERRHAMRRDDSHIKAFRELGIIDEALGALGREFFDLHIDILGSRVERDAHRLSCVSRADMSLETFFDLLNDLLIYICSLDDNHHLGNATVTEEVESISLHHGYNFHRNYRSKPRRN